MHSGHFTGYPMPKLVACTVALQQNEEQQQQQQQQEQEIVPNAFMVSDLILALVRDGLIAEEQPDPTHIILRELKKGELRPQILEGGVEKDRFDASWCIVRVNESAPKKVRSLFRHSHFPRENRFISQTPQDIREYFNHPSMARGAAGTSSSSSSSSSSSWARFSDFHLLLYVARLFDVATSFSLCDAVLNETPVDEGMEDVLKSLA
ncbi:hypothetical protein, conserved [Eimeria tenella]|uniref:Nuclear pore localisation protein NPL4 C-terminal domain-containing protein n=1 Tax=Eimeria tenella TaxID=5802 RepID=U6KPW0_EIMTE|nr:hypothetical protein, conserved [Eimeria tenella]CDJ40167.1 hypothetical protein, conserved [Eimeria tenella]|eukprot:XP_013230920.1 hypothetical protein, conserved [Eimeria tenella]